MRALTLLWSRTFLTCLIDTCFDPKIRNECSKSLEMLEGLHIGVFKPKVREPKSETIINFG